MQRAVASSGPPKRGAIAAAPVGISSWAWNGLAVGEKVGVVEHIRNGRLVSGVVAFVHIRRGANDVGVRLDSSPARVLWPTRHEIVPSLTERARVM